MRRETELWVERAEYDIVTAEAMLKACRYLYVAFACQQAVEKYLKAIIQEKTGQHPPHLHNLVPLSRLADIAFAPPHEDFLVLLSQYYLNTRYVDVKQKLAAEMNRDKERDCLNKSRKIIKCLKEGLPT